MIYKTTSQNYYTNLLDGYHFNYDNEIAYILCRIINLYKQRDILKTDKTRPVPIDWFKPFGFSSRKTLQTLVSANKNFGLNIKVDFNFGLYKGHMAEDDDLINIKRVLEEDGQISDLLKKIIENTIDINDFDIDEKGGIIYSPDFMDRIIDAMEFFIDYKEEGFNKIELFLKQIMSYFKSANLSNFKNKINYFGYNKTKSIFIENFKENYENYGNAFNITSRDKMFDLDNLMFIYGLMILYFENLIYFPLLGTKDNTYTVGIRLTSDFITEITNTEKSKQKIINIIISNNHGIYPENNSEKSYKILKTSNRFKIIKILYEKKILTANELSEYIKGNSLSNLKHTITDINKLFIQKTELDEEIIISIETGGYSLNNKFYKFIM